MRRVRTVTCLGCLLGCLAPPAALAQQPAPTPPVVIDGPSSDLALSTGLGMSVARDGSGGVTYLKRVGANVHVVASALTGGAFEAPVELDSGLAADASSPVVAAGNGGLLLVAFVSGGQLYVVDKPSAQAPFGSPVSLIGGAASPAISITNLGKAYLAFTEADGAGYDIRTAYYYRGNWSLEPAALNVTPADDAGTGSGRPAVAAAGDGVGIVAWGENGGIYSRRVWGTAPSVVHEQADGPLPGCSETSSDDPVVGTEGDSSYAVVAFQEQLSCGSQNRSRVLANRLRGSAYDGLTQPDGLSTDSADGAVDPQIAMGEYGRGMVISQRTSNNDLYATALGDNGTSASTSRVNSLPLGQPPDAVAAMAGLVSDLVVWQQTPGGNGSPEIRLRYAADGASLGPELVISSSTSGPTNAADGLAAAGDGSGDAAAAWLQGAGASTELVAVRLYQPPGEFAALHPFQYERLAQPTLAWAQAKEAWGPITYSATFDGTTVGQTTSTTFQLPDAVSDGPHIWQVTATNPAGQTSTARPATVFVDTVAPTVGLSASARARVHVPVTVHVVYGDAAPAGEPASDASGVADLLIRWGDGSQSDVRLGSHHLSHRYGRAGRYRITAVVTDRAGNASRASASLRIFAHHRRHKRGRKGHRR